jgi:gluconokinase
MHVGIDIGTSSVKAVAIDRQGKTQVLNQIAYSIFSSQNGFQEQDPDEIWEATRQIIKGLGIKPTSICFSSAMHSLMAVDREGKPLTQLITWADGRAKNIADDLKNSDIGTKIYRQTGTAIHAMSPLCKLLWFKENQPELLIGAYKWIGIKEYICFKLFGKYAIDYSIASATGLFDVFNLKWNQKSLEIIGISEDKLSKPVPTTTLLSASSTLPVSSQTTFVIGASDGSLANLGSGAFAEGEIAATIGTSGAIRMTSAVPMTDEKMRTFCYYTDENQYIIGGAINNGGIILQWLHESFSNLKVKEESITQIFALAAQAPTGTEGLIFLPYLFGERAPIWDANAKGVFFGIQKKHTQAHFFRAVLEGIMFALYSVGKVLEDENFVRGKEKVIYATGGFTKTDFWVQMLADIFNQRVIVPNSSEGTAIGACILAMKALGEITQLSEARHLIRTEKVFFPNPQAHQIYQKNFEIFEKLYTALKPLF